MSEQTFSQDILYQAYIDGDLADLIPEYLDNRRNDIALIELALQAGDFGKIRTIGHSMKGSGGGFGFDRITEIGQTLEEAALHNMSSSIQSSLDVLNDYLLHVEVIYQDD